MNKKAIYKEPLVIIMAIMSIISLFFYLTAEIPVTERDTDSTLEKAGLNEEMEETREKLNKLRVKLAYSPNATDEELEEIKAEISELEANASQIADKADDEWQENWEKNTKQKELSGSIFFLIFGGLLGFILGAQICKFHKTSLSEEMVKGISAVLGAIIVEVIFYLL